MQTIPFIFSKIIFYVVATDIKNIKLKHFSSSLFISIVCMTHRRCLLQLPTLFFPFYGVVDAVVRLSFYWTSRIRSYVASTAKRLAEKCWTRSNGTFSSKRRMWQIWIVNTVQVAWYSLMCLFYTSFVGTAMALHRIGSFGATHSIACVEHSWPKSANDEDGCLNHAKCCFRSREIYVLENLIHFLLVKWRLVKGLLYRMHLRRRRHRIRCAFRCSWILWVRVPVTLRLTLTYITLHASTSSQTPLLSTSEWFYFHLIPVITILLSMPTTRNSFNVWHQTNRWSFTLSKSMSDDDDGDDDDGDDGDDGRANCNAYMHCAHIYCAIDYNSTVCAMCVCALDDSGTLRFNGYNAWNNIKENDRREIRNKKN